jgi:hypothetical protein
LRLLLGIDPSLPQTGLTIYTGPLNPTAETNSTWSWITTRLSSINYYVAISISMNVVLAVLCIMQRYAWRKQSSEHSPVPEAATEMDVECITDVLEVADDESTSSTELVVTTPITSTATIPVTSAPATVACITDTAPIAIASSPCVISSSLDATTSAPTAGVGADSLAPSNSMSYAKPSIIKVLLWIICMLLQELAAAHRAFYAAQSDAKHDDKGPIIAEYHEESDADICRSTSRLRLKLKACHRSYWFHSVGRRGGSPPTSHRRLRTCWVCWSCGLGQL